jgi:hypothetical protein
VGTWFTSTSAFAFGTNLYYAKLTSDPATACAAGGTWDGANCYLASPPAGSSAFVKDNAFYLQPACGTVPY